jgi:hypothetical protein
MAAMPAVFTDRAVTEALAREPPLGHDGDSGGVGEVAAVEWQSSWRYEKQVTDGVVQTSHIVSVDTGTDPKVCRPVALTRLLCRHYIRPNRMLLRLLMSLWPHVSLPAPHDRVCTIIPFVSTHSLGRDALCCVLCVMCVKR